MRLRLPLPRAAAFGICLLVTACGTAPRPQFPIDPPVTEVEPVLHPDEAIARLVAEAESYFTAGDQELMLGHLDRARREFDRAIETLLVVPGGARGDAVLREHFDRLVDRIAAREAVFLSQGDGFTEQESEAASIDQLLELSIFESTPDEALARTVSADLASGQYDIPIPLNDQVLRYVDLFQGRLRSFLTEGLTRGTQYLPMIHSVFRAEGLPLDLAYVPLIESAYKPNAFSRARARGVWQFMAATGREYGLVQDWYVDERSDPEKATYAAAQYLRVLHRMFGGDWHLALASYNGGPGRVQRALQRSGHTSFWDLAASTRFLPRETREYVPMILAAIIIAKNPEQYGFEIAPLPPVDYDRLTVEVPVDLRRIAEWVEVSVDDIRDLNPELRRWTTPLRQAGFQLKLPPGTAVRLAERLAEAPPSEVATLSWYTVRRGDTLGSIAQRLRVRTADLAEANNLRINSRIQPGQELVVPRAPTTLMAAQAERPTPGAAGTPSEARPVVHRVQRGDTLIRIARRYGTTVAHLRAVNSLPSTQIRIGQRLTVQTGQASALAARPASPDASPLVHRVQQGDTLIHIARRYQTTVDDLKQWNQLQTDRIRVGDRLTVYARSPAAGLD